MVHVNVCVSQSIISSTLLSPAGVIVTVVNDTVIYKSIKLFMDVGAFPFYFYITLYTCSRRNNDNVRRCYVIDPMCYRS